MRKILLLLITNLLFVSLYAQKADSCFYVQVDLANRWIWRGLSYSETPVIQPSFGFSNNKLNLLFWGSYAFERRYLIPAAHQDALRNRSAWLPGS